jgi:TonB family protein
MFPHPVLLATGMAVSLTSPGSGQEPVKFDEASVEQHVERRADAVYPPIAQAAHVQGKVIPEIAVNPKGEVQSGKVVSGPTMLQQAALDSVRQWTFHPFEGDGVPVHAGGEVSVDFSLGGNPATEKKDEEIASRLFPLSDQCHQALAKDDNSPEAGQICSHAADLAVSFDEGGRLTEKRSAFVYAAWALGSREKFNEALNQADKAVATVKLGHDDSSGNSSAYGVRGVIEGNPMWLDDANRDLTTAEDYERKGIEWAKSVKFEHLDRYPNSLALYLRLHSQLLAALKPPDDAKGSSRSLTNFNRSHESKSQI